MTELLYLRDAELREFDATVTAVDATGAGSPRPDRLLPDRWGQPHDTGTLGSATVDERAQGPSGPRRQRGRGCVALPRRPGAGGGGAGARLVDWDRRHELMRTHTALHVLCGVIWNEWGKPVTGGNMEPLEARMDFEFDPLPEGFAARVAELVNAEIAADRPIEVSFLPRDTALEDADLIRTKVNLIPESVTEIRVVDIVGLDKQADGGTHVRSTGEIGHFEVVKTESKGKGNKRLRIRLS